MKIFLLIILLLFVPLQAQEEILDVPVLTEIQKSQIETILQKLRIAQLTLQNAQLTLQIAQDQMDTTRLSAQDMFKNLQKSGFRLDIQKMEYVLIPKEEKK